MESPASDKMRLILGFSFAIYFYRSSGEGLLTKITASLETVAGDAFWRESVSNMKEIGVFNEILFFY